MGLSSHKEKKKNIVRINPGRTVTLLMLLDCKLDVKKSSRIWCTFDVSIEDSLLTSLLRFSPLAYMKKRKCDTKK